MSINLSIAEEIRMLSPNFQIGIIQATVVVEPSAPELKGRLQDLISGIQLHTEAITQMETIVAIRNTYQKLGKDPSRYRGSAEALLRRISQGKGMYFINNVVDINNYTSLISALSVGSYDLSHIDNSILVRKGLSGEQYKGIGKDIINIESLPVFSDSNGAFGSPTSDSERAMIQGSTKDIVMLLLDFGGITGHKLKDYMEISTQLLVEYAQAKNIKQSIIS